MQYREERARGMEQMLLVKYAATKDAPTTPYKEVSVKGTGQRSKNAVTRDAPTKHRRGESASVMEQRLKYAVMKDALILSRKEACAKGMEIISAIINMMRVCALGVRRGALTKK